MNVLFLKRATKGAAYTLFAALIIAALTVAAFAYNRNDIAPGIQERPFETSPVEGNGGRLGDNYNAPAANGGNEGAPNGGNANGGPNDGGNAGGGLDNGVPYGENDGGSPNADYDYDNETDERGEVLGVTDTNNSATVGIVIAILIAAAVIVFIIALLPRGTSGV